MIIKPVNSVSVWGKGEKNCEEREGKGWEPGDKHLRPLFRLSSLSCNCQSSVSKIVIVTWIQRNVITLACKKGVGRQQTTFVSCQNTAFPMSFFLWRVDYALEGLELIEKMRCLPPISYWEFVTRILIFCGYCFWSAWFALWYKNIYCRSKSSSVKRQKTPC